MADMPRSPFRVPVGGGELVGWQAGRGPRVLMLHGGPGMGGEYMDEVAAELGEDFHVAMHQQRGVPPSTLEGPFEIAREVADVTAVLDALGWERVWLLGHSWGGHLLLHVMVAAPERVLGGLAIDPLGGVGDGGGAAFEAAMLERTPEEVRARAQALDERAMAGDASPEELTEALRLVWPAYFASSDRVAPFPEVALRTPPYAGLMESIVAELPALEAALPGIRAPFGSVCGASSPMPWDSAGQATVRAIPGAWIHVIEEAGHLPWFERPGCVATAMRRLVGASVAP
jgi:pimeloyl-ACP methyl ester carboxylesterase